MNDVLVRWPRVAQFHRLSAEERADVLSELHDLDRLTPEQAAGLLAAFEEALNDPALADPKRVEVFESLVSTIAPFVEPPPPAPGYATVDNEAAAAPIDARLQRLAELYTRMGRGRPARDYILRILGAAGTPTSLSLLVDRLAADPPESRRSADLAFAPLWRRASLPRNILFPRLLDAISHEHLAGLAIELANHLARKQPSLPHPAAGRAEALATLFGSLVDHLRQIEENPNDFGDNPREISLKVDHAVGLAAAAADALGLIGDNQYVGQLQRAFTISHRRVQTEAAAALTRLGDDGGLAQLFDLAVDAGYRTRALHYLEELGKLEQLDEEWRSPQARAEGELAAHLSGRSMFGLAPTHLTHLDTRTLTWPSYDEPVECFLFVYEYNLPNGSLEGLGLVGPALHAFSHDLSKLQLGDVYAMFCGWQVEHEDISRIPAAQFGPREKGAVTQVIERIYAEGYSHLKPVDCGLAFNEIFWTFAGQKDNQVGLVLVSGPEMQAEFFPYESKRSLGPDQGFWLAVGRRILREFNGPEALK